MYFFFFNDTATTEIYTLSLHDALPISLLLALPAGAEPELWTCTRTDGSTMFTDHVPTQAGCRAYTVRSELSYFKRAAEPPEVRQEAPTPPEPKAQAQSALPPITINIVISSPPPRPPVSDTLAPAGEIPFETYRMLSVGDRKSTRLNSSHLVISYAVFCLRTKEHNV